MPTFKVSNFLSRLPAEMSATLFSGATRSRLAAEQVLFYAGDVGDGCYRIEEGLAKVVVSSPNGDERSIAILGPGSIVGELSMLDGLPRSAAVIALRDCTLQFISRELFERCTQQHPEIYRYLTAMLALRLREADEVLAAMSFMTVKGRLARAFLELGEHLGVKDASGHITLSHKISQRELAAIAGIARENVSRTLATWKRRRVIALTGGHYRIMNTKAIKAEMGEA